MKRFLYLIFLITAAAALPAAEVTLTLMAGSDSFPAGQSARVDIVALNPGSLEAPFTVEPWLAATLSIGGQSWPVTLRASGNSALSVPAGGFSARTFAFDVPAGALGRGFLEVKRPDGSALRAVIDVAAASRTPAPSAPSAASPLDRLVGSAPASSTLSRNFAGRFLPNLPIYFIYGDAAQAAKFQFSFDYRLATIVLGDEGHQTVSTLRFGYTQRSLWDLDDKSSPFYDTSYMPEIAISTEAPTPTHETLFTWLGLRAGFQHESNGKDGTDSRSLNVFYFRPRFVLGSVKDWFIVALPEVQAYIGDLEDNPRLKDYRGYGKLRFYLGRNDGPALMASTWAGKDFDHVSYQLDLSVPLQLKWLNIETYLYAQYFNGYGESLRTFDQKSDALRLGFGLVR